MKSRLLVYAVLLLFPALLLADPAPHSLDPSTCGSWTQTDWDRYLAQENYVSFDLQNFESIENSCKANIQSLGIRGCLDRINGYYGQFKHTIENGYNFSARTPDRKYYASEPKDAMVLPKELLGHGQALAPNWKQIAAAKGWKWVLFPSVIGKTSRLVMYVPGKDYDRFYVFFSINSKNNDPTTFDGVQMQAIKKGGDTDPAKIYFRTWGFDTPDHSPKLEVYGDRCVSCHINGPRAIYPKPHGEFPVQLGGVSSLQQFSDLIVQKKPLDLSAYYDPKYFPTKLNVGKLDQCANCHNGEDRASLAYLVDPDLGSFDSFNVDLKVVHEKSMPKESDWDISDNERKKIPQSVEKDYYDEFRKWLTETKCSKSPAPAAKSAEPAESAQ